MNERSDWERHKNYPPRWSWATWPERAEIVAVWIASGVVGLAMVIGTIFILGLMIENVGQYHEEHDRCLKLATNGYEIKQCR